MAKNIFHMSGVNYYAYQGVRNVRFSWNLTCFVFLKQPFWDSPFCLITDELYRLYSVSWLLSKRGQNHFWQWGVHEKTNCGGKVVAKSSSVAVISKLDSGCKNKCRLISAQTLFSCNSNLANQNSSGFFPNFCVNANENAQDYEVLIYNICILTWW